MPRLPYRTKTFVMVAGDPPKNELIGFQAYGAVVANFSGQFLQLPGRQGIPNFSAPNSRGTFALEGDETTQLMWAAPPGNQQPSAAPLQQVVITFTTESLPDAGGPTQLSTQVSSFSDGTAASPGLFASAEQTTGFFHLSPGVIGLSILGTEVARWTAAGQRISGALTPDADGTRDIGSAALRFRDLFASSSIAVGTGPAQSGALRIPNATGSSGLVARRSTGLSDVPLIGLDGSDRIQISPFGFAIDVSGDTSFVGTFVAMGTTPSTAGVLRIPNNQSIGVRNAGNTANLSLAFLDTSNNYQWGDAAGVHKFNSGALAIGATPATVGALRMGSGQQIISRNAANTADQGLMFLDATDRVVVGQGGAIIYGSSGFLAGSTVALTNGAAAAAGTLNNAPVAGNPTKWAPVLDNGVTRYVPMW